MTPIGPRPLRLLVSLVLALLLSLLPAPLALAELAEALPPEGTLLSETWYVQFLGDERIGWEHETFREIPGGVRFEYVTDSTLRRLGTTSHVHMELQSDESSEGAFLGGSMVMEMGQAPVVTRWVLDGDGILETSRQGGRVQEKRLPPPVPEALGALAARRLLARAITEGRSEVQYKTLAPENGLKLVTVQGHHVRDETYEAPDGRVKASVWQFKMSHLPIPMTGFYREDGRTLRSDVSMGVFSMSTRVATREQALEGVDAATVQGVPGDPSDILARTLITLDMKVPETRTLAAARLVLRTRGDPLPAIPSAGAQRLVALRKRGRLAVIDVEPDRRLPAPPEDLANAEYLDASTLVDPTDPLIVELAEKAAGPAGADPLAQADALRAFVHRHIRRKNLAVAFASASEVARERSGDCTEHAILLTALLRARGIPARFASGLVHVSDFQGHRNVLGWHAWTQALIDGAWVDLDATLEERYHPLHVFLGASSLAQGALGGDLVNQLTLMGSLDVRVESLRTRP